MDEVQEQPDDSGEENDLEEDELEVEHKSSPALTINIQSWWTPIIGVVLLIVGLLAGYFARPLITPDLTGEVSGSSSVPTQEVAAQPTTDPVQRQQLMEFLLPQVRHFKGDVNAPVTLIEFSDFQ